MDIWYVYFWHFSPWKFEPSVRTWAFWHILSKKLATVSVVEGRGGVWGGVVVCAHCTWHRCGHCIVQCTCALYVHCMYCELRAHDTDVVSHCEFSWMCTPLHPKPPHNLIFLGPFCAHFRFKRIVWFTNMCSFRILDRGLGLVKVILPELAFISPSWIKERIFVDLVILHLLWTYLRKNRTRCS